MTNHKKLLLLIVFQFFSFLNVNSQNRPLKIYEKDSITIKSFDYEGIKPFLNQKNDTLYVVNFWATWCIPCIEELPHFEKLNQKYKAEKFKMILISLDFPKMVESRLIPFIKKKNLQAEVILLNDPEANRWIEEINKEWTGAIPATIIYKNDKHTFYEQSFTETELESEIIKHFN